MQAKIFILRHDPAGLQGVRDIQILRQIIRRRHQPDPQLRLLAVIGEGDAIHRADIDAGVALDAGRFEKDGLNIAVQTALGILEGELVVKA